MKRAPALGPFTENPCVGGSIPPPGTSTILIFQGVSCHAVNPVFLEKPRL